MSVVIKVKRGTAANATAENEILSSGELGFETDTGKFKIGDGSTSWKDLEYSNPDVFFDAAFFNGDGTVLDMIGIKDGAITEIKLSSDVQTKLNSGGGGGTSSDASTTVKGITKLSVAPVLSTNPIAAGNNDPRLSDARTPLTHTHPQSEITGLESDLSGKQDFLVSGTNIKTINSTSILGSGNIEISGGGDPVSDASTTVKGIVKLSVAPDVSTDPISVGTNDPRMTDSRDPLSHTHTKSDITDFTHTHLKTDITDFAHTHPQSEIVNLETDLSASSIKTKYESNINTNAFTDTDKTNLDANTLKRSYPSADETKLAGIDSNANNYSHPNHTGDVTSTGDGVTVIGADIVTEAKLHPDVRTKLNAEVTYIPAIERESNTVLFDKDYIIGNAAARTGNVLFDFTGAELGASTMLIHQDASAFTLPAESVILSGTVSDTVANYIYFLITDITAAGEKVHVTISQEL